MQNRLGRGSGKEREWGCLPGQDNFVPESETASFERGVPTWKAGTLPTELLPPNRAYLRLAEAQFWATRFPRQAPPPLPERKRASASTVARSPPSTAHHANI